MGELRNIQEGARLLPMPKPIPDDEQVPAASAPDRLGGMIDECLRGKAFTITRYGRPVARLVPITTTEEKKK